MLALEHPLHIASAPSSSSPPPFLRDIRRPAASQHPAAAVAAPRPLPPSSSHPPPSSSSAASSHTPASFSSSPHRSQPFDIHQYPAQDLLRLLASLLVQIAAANDTLPPAHSPEPSLPSPDALAARPVWNTLTSASRAALGTPTSPLSFHARNVPTIPLEAYLLRILKYCPTTNEVFLSLLVYFDRMARLASESTGRTFVIDSYNIHRLVIAGVTVASKFFSDVFYTNSRYAKVGGLPQSELNQLELQFLLLNDFRLMISEDEMQRYAQQLLVFSTTHTVPSPLSHAPSSHAHPPPSHHHPHSAHHAPANSHGVRRVASAMPLSNAPASSTRHALAHSASTQSFASAASSSTQDTETESGSTDEEPTIRPTWSVRSSSVSRDMDDEMDVGFP